MHTYVYTYCLNDIRGAVKWRDGGQTLNFIATVYVNVIEVVTGLDWNETRRVSGVFAGKMANQHFATPFAGKFTVDAPRRLMIDSSESSASKSLTLTTDPVGVDTVMSLMGSHISSVLNIFVFLLSSKDFPSRNHVTEPIPMQNG